MVKKNKRDFLSKFHWFISHSTFHISQKLLLFFLLFSTTSCTYNAATGRSEFIFVSTQEEVSMGQALANKLDEQYEEVTDKKYVDRINRIGLNLAQVSDRQDYSYTFHVVNKDELNAFTIPGGKIYVFTGLIDKLKTDSEIAFVLAHEIGHCAARHVVKKYQAAVGYNVAASVLLGIFDQGAARSIASLSSDVVSNLVFSAYGRQDEYEADRLGVKYAFLAGYDLKGAVEAMTLLMNATEKGSAPSIFRTHPHAKDRLEVIEEEIIKIQNAYK